ncbi:SIR2 family protein [Microbacterium sp. CFBP 13617]|uniref:SIR2 family protein n=1 Tax=Microbacterium sp. CFBP 13617 TaxID=2774035 RepID=UPI001784E07E|nr:SIR2 family protein [Microbacterium sp. CFBP 13617]MBD8219566.1 SIR2 family protein [Microbacterium sp. CFBP 13617]
MSSVLAASTMLAVAMQSQPGVYAVLLGSGVSTGAGIPTGWGIVRDLVRQVAVAADPGDAGSHDLAVSDPEAWWAQRGDGALGYAALLEQLAPTAAARQGVLAKYFEPTDEERAEGIKAPSRAHLALAELVKKGTVRVILTTNFDRLMEQALEAVGVSPQVISRPEAVNGMAPLAHAKATVIKLHGDYQDLGTRNTPAELETYPPEWLSLLSQVFSEYGLLISGWSAEWDAALVASIENGTRRYPIYWDSRSSRGSTARHVLVARAGKVIDAAGADELFADLAASIEALTSLTESPLSTAMAVARVKRYLPDLTRRIELHDLVMGIANRVAEMVSEAPVTADRTFDGSAFQSLYERYLEAAAPLLDVTIAGTWHDPEGLHDQLWLDVLQRLLDAGTAPLNSANQMLERARLIPALLVLSIVGTVAAARGRESLFLRLATEVEGRPQMGTGEPLPAGQLLHVFRVLEKDWVNAMPRWKKQRWLYPMSHLLLADLRRFFVDYIRLDTDFVTAFHGQEYRIGLIQSQLRASGRGYPAAEGEYVGERGWTWDTPHVPFAEVAFRRDSGRRADWPWTRYLGGSDSFETILVSHRELLWSYNRS